MNTEAPAFHSTHTFCPMNRLYLLILSATLLSGAGQQLVAQTSDPQSPGNDNVKRSVAHPPASDAIEVETLPAFEFVEPVSPRYDEEELARLIVYPAEARDARIEGQVILRFVVDTAGRARKVESIVPADPLLVAAAVSALNQLQFVPGTVNGVPMATRMTLPITFKL